MFKSYIERVTRIAIEETCHSLIEKSIELHGKIEYLEKRIQQLEAAQKAPVKRRPGRPKKSEKQKDA